MDKLATFRINEEHWKAFQILCKENKSNASAVLIRHIQDCLDSQAIGKASELVPSSSVTRSEFDGLRDELGALRLELGIIRSGLTIAAPISPIAAVTIGSPTINAESLVQPELQPSNEVENNPIMTRAKDETQSQPELQPIGIDQDATTNATSKPIKPTLMTATELHRALGSGYTKESQTLGKIVNKAARTRQLPPDLVALGVYADWEKKRLGNKHNNRLRWLWIERP